MPFKSQLLVATVLLGVFFGWLTYEYKSQELVVDKNIQNLQHEEHVLQEFSELVYMMQSKNVVTAKKYVEEASINIKDSVMLNTPLNQVSAVSLNGENIPLSEIEKRQAQKRKLPVKTDKAEIEILITKITFNESTPKFQVNSGGRDFWLKSELDTSPNTSLFEDPTLLSEEDYYKLIGAATELKKIKIVGSFEYDDMNNIIGGSVWAVCK